ncbi:MAG TPA: BACON domain-containing carbohydrate-binding protein [Vicinamibacterales bacterium]|nr:BACON domain-containing carbohydrate-binding protein [Vicinamibacterales bacterium]
MGGNARVTVTTARECAWSASVEVEWLSVVGGASGQGDGAVEFRASTNPDPVVRRGTLRLNDQRAEVSQAAADCVFTLGGTSASFPQEGGSGTVGVAASSQLCTWTARSDADWVSIRAGASGTGSGTVAFEVAGSTGPPRTATLIIAAQRFSVTQSLGCTYTLSSGSHSVGAAGGQGSFAVNAAAGCPWTAASNVPWITVEPASGAGPGTVRFTVAATDGPARTGTVLAGGQVFTITQSPGCAYSVAPSSVALAAAGGAGTVTVTAAPGCDWTAVTEAPWIAITGGLSGSGSGMVSFTAAPTTGPARTGTLLVAGQRVSVTQSPGCTYAIEPASHNVGASGGDGTVGVTTAADCAWTATSGADWIRITTGASGSGNGAVRYSVSATDGPSRTGTLAIAGHTFAVTQSPGCTVTLSPENATAGESGGALSFDVQSGSLCAWTATSNAPWISITGGASGSGNGTVRLAIAANDGPGRSGTVTAGGRTFTVSQEGGCTVTLTASTATLPAAGGSGSVAVRAGEGCTWTAVSQDAWLTITQGGSGTGAGTVGFTGAANTGAPRSGTILIGGRTFTVNQEGGCSVVLAPEQHATDAAGGTVSVAVSTAAGCAWTATANAEWIAVTSGASGVGPGEVHLLIAQNTGAARTGTALIAGRTFTITQEGACSHVVAPDPVVIGSGGGAVTLQLTTGASCGWTASSQVTWAAFEPPTSGTGSATLQLAVEANAGPARAGSLLIGGRTVAIAQGSGCTYALSSSSQNMPHVGGSRTVTMNTGEGCAWSAASQVPWITIIAGETGPGPQTLQFNVEANATGAPRSGTIVFTIPGHDQMTFTVNQGM